MNSFICGGLVKESVLKEDSTAYMMCTILPDEWYERWKNARTKKEKEDIVAKYGYSII